MDQVERIAEITETTHRIGGQKPWNRLGKPANLFALGDHAEDHDEQRAADRVPGPPRGEMLDALDEEATGDDHRQARDGRDRAQKPRHHDADEHDGEDTADEQLPQARPRVVVVPRLIRLETAVSVPDRHQTDRREDGRVQPLGWRFSDDPEQRGDAENQREGDDIELALHRHRPQVLQRRDGGIGRAVILAGERELPVLVVQQRRLRLGEDIGPRGLRAQPHRQPDGGGHHHDEHRIQTTDKSPQILYRGQTGSGGGGASHERAEEEEPGQCQEDVDAAGHPAHPHMEEDDEGDGYAA